MNDKKSPFTVVIIAGAVLGLCCVSSFVGAMLFGIATPLSILRSDGVYVPGGPVATVPADVGIEGAWSFGAPGISELGDRKAAAWASPSEGQRWVFRGNHSCESEVLTRDDATDCAKWRLVTRANCSWSMVGNQLTLTFGPGTQLTKSCGNEFSESALPAMNVKVIVRSDDDKTLTMSQGDVTTSLTREP